MPGKISGDRAGRRPQQSLARGVSSVAVIAWLATVMTPAAEAQGIRQDPMRQASIGPDFPGRLNPAQPSGPAAGAATAQTSNAPAAVAEEVGILFLRADGGDPQQLQADSGSTLVFIACRDGEGRAYRNGREVGLEAAVKESAAARQRRPVLTSETHTPGRRAGHGCIGTISIVPVVTTLYPDCQDHNCNK